MGHIAAEFLAQRRCIVRINLRVIASTRDRDVCHAAIEQILSAQIYTNNAATLGQELSRDVSHSPAIQQEPGAHKIEPQTTHTNQISQGFGLGL